MSVSAADLPKSSALWAHFKQGDFIDCYRATAVPVDMEMEEAVRTAIAYMPPWVQALMDLRNRIVGPLGLKAGKHSRNEAEAEAGALELDADGERIVFTVRERLKDEIILGEDDRHLDFRVTVYRTPVAWYVATWVHPHAWYGWLYLYTILPFHKAIMRLSAKRLEKAAHPPA
ncbi:MULTISPECIES: DUF2867 domain-containing protein [Kordiimonas]|uniref:DUF2867 domain-containing protein n=1 Tax=Kordiimonas TaxID=288021 RepID=UPI00257BDF1C|nr:DUF2867 domain-containing protein [Kordiimonas sp. UBA4487]